MERGRRTSRHRRPKRSIQTTQKDKKFLAKFLPLSSHDIWEDLRADEEKKLLKSYILDPTGSISYYWTMVVCLAVVYHLWTVTFRVAFLDPFNDPECCSVLWILVDQLSTIIFALDFISQFRTSYLKDGMMESDPEELYEHYTTSFFFKLDLAAVIPFDLLFMILLRTTQVPSLVHLPKMLKVYRLREFFDRTEIRTHFPNACRMLFLTHNVVVIIHWNGCAYFWLCRILGFGSDPWVYPSWDDLGYEDWGFLSRQYIYSFYWSTLTLTTIGELPVPQTNLEFMFVTTNYLIGILLFASIVGNVGNIIVNVQKNRSKFQTKIDNIKDYMQQRKVPNNLQHRVIKFYNYMWTNGHPISNESVLASLPEKLRAEIGIYVHMDTLKKVAFFERCETSLLSDLVLCLKTQIYLPGDYVCRKGDVGHEMYIVNRGRLEVLDEDNVTVKSVLTTGSYFGEISILDLGETRHRRTANVRSVGYSDLLCLSQVDLLMVLKNYPKTLENLKRAGKTILEEEKNRQKKRESCCSTVHTLIEDFEKDDDGDSDSDDDMPRPRFSTTKRISQVAKQPHVSVQNQVTSIHTRMNSLEMTMQRILSQLEKLQENRNEHAATEHDSETDKEGDEGKEDEGSDRSDSLSRDNTLFGRLRAKRRVSSQFSSREPSEASQGMAALLQPNQQLSLGDGTGERSFFNFFSSLPAKPATTLRIFDRNEFYTVHGEDAMFTAQEVFRTQGVIKYWGSGEKRLAYVVLSKMNFGSVVKDLLLVRRFRVEVYCSKSKGSNEWSLMYKGSPGNLQQFEDILFTGNDVSMATGVIAVKLANENGQRMVGMAYIDAMLRKLGVCQFSDNAQLSNVESLLVQLAPKECVLIHNDQHPDAAKLRSVVGRSNILITERKRGDFQAQDIVQDLNRLLDIGPDRNASMLSEIDQSHAMSCLSALIKYLELLSDTANQSQYHMITLDFSQYMRLDSAACRALHIDHAPSEVALTGGDGSHEGELVRLLNKCQTQQGRRLMVQWIRQPLLDKSKIEERLDLVEVFVKDESLRQMLREELMKRMPDFYRVAKKFQRHKATLQDCVRIYQAVLQLPNIVSCLKGYHGDHQSLLIELFIDPLQESIEDFTKYIEMIETTIDLDMVSQHEFLIKPSFDDTLQELRSSMDAVETKISTQLPQAARDLSLEANKTVKLESTSQLGYFLRVTRKYEKNLRGHAKYIVIETRNDGVKFTTSSLRSMSEHHSTLREQYNIAQENLANEVLEIASGYSVPLYGLNDIIAHLDTILSFAHVSTHVNISYTRPTITPRGEGDIVLLGARHPCIEVQDDVTFIPNDVHLIRDKNVFQIITGPNMGGKSTYIRQIGTIVLMAQIGCFVPCDSATVSVVDCILARVGASDSQMKGVSTFMAEMLETATILKTATKESLIVIDELGRGTSTYDGFGLAWAISEHIVTKIKAFCLFATHFHELTALADAVPTVTNLHVTAHTTEDTLTLLYKVKPGVCDRSFGIHVAEMAHFPSKVVDFARHKAAELEVSHGLSDDGEAMDEPSSKKKRVEIKEGEGLIKDFLQTLKSLPLASMSDSQAMDEVKRLKGELIAKNNSFILKILQQSTV